jgi:hypothetical protein
MGSAFPGSAGGYLLSTDARKFIPYVDHPELPRIVADELHVWRYFTFAQFLALLEFQALHFTRVDLLPDPFVDIESHPNLTALPPMSAAGVRRALDMMRISRQAIFVNSWYGCGSELPGVWESCGGKNCGIAVRSSIGGMKTALKRSTQNVHISRVLYLDYDIDPIPLGNAYLSALHKEKKLQAEQEVRALFLQVGRDSTTFSPGPREGVDVGIDAATLIEGVLAAPESDAWFYRLVAAECKRCHVNVGF